MIQDLRIKCYMYIGRTLCATFSYTDDMAFVAPLVCALKQLIKVSDNCALDYDTLSNLNNSLH